MLMVRALNGLGYAVDLVSHSDAGWLPHRSYDLFVGHGGTNFSRIGRRLPASTPRIYFSTGIEWREFNRRETERFHRLSARRGLVLPRDRQIHASEEGALTDADGIICLGNTGAVSTYNAHPVVVGLDNSVRETAWRRWEEKDFAAGRRRYLFFSGDGSVHKGLDLLLEAASNAPVELHVCHRVDETFAAAYARELSGPNIHVHGFLRERSARFLELALACNWVITASCAEGQPGSILECMAHGMVPVLPLEANIDYEDFAAPISARSPESIVEAMRALSVMAPEECKRRAGRAAEVARQRYAEAVFERRFAEAVRHIVEKGAAVVHTPEWRDC